MKPILFNTGRVRAILDGRKTVTRRVVKPQHLSVLESPFHQQHPEVSDNLLIEKLCEPPYRPGDILYVRETWTPLYPNEESTEVCGYLYKADNGDTVADYDRKYPEGKDWTWEGRWRPSIHMPKEAARIFLQVTDVRVERLQEIKNDGCVAEGAVQKPNYTKRGDLVLHNRYRKEFAELWDSTIKPADRDRYGWEANPWVWVIEFERCEKPRTLLKNGRI